MALNPPTGLVHRLSALIRGEWYPHHLHFLQEGNLLPLTVGIRTILLLVLSYLLMRRADQYSAFRLTLWISTFIVFACYIVYLYRAQYLRSDPATIKRVAQIQVVVDLSFFSFWYFLSGNAESHLVFLLFLPLLITARHFSIEITLIIYVTILGLIVAMMTSVNLGLNVVPSVQGRGFPSLQQFITDAIIFAGVALPLARSEYLRRTLKQQRAASRKRLTMLVKQGVSLGQRSELDSLFDLATQIARAELGSETASLFLYDEGACRRRKIAGLSDEWFPEESYLPGQGITGQVLPDPKEKRFGVPVRTNFASSNTTVIQDHLARYQAALNSGEVSHLVAVPLDGQNHTIGVLRAVNKVAEDGTIDDHGFTPEDEDTLVAIAALLTLAVASSQRESKAQAIFEVNQTMTQSVDEHQVSQKIAEVIVGLGYKASCVLLRGSQDRVLLAGQSGFAARDCAELLGLEGLMVMRRKVLERGALQKQPTLRHSPWPEVISWAARTGMDCVLYLPLVTQRRTLGILEIYGHTDELFHESTIQTLEVFATQAAASLTQARTYAGSQRQLHRLEKLSEMFNIIMHANDLVTLFDEVAHHAAALLEAEDCSLFWVNRTDSTIDIQASHCVPTTQFGQRKALINDAPGAGLHAFVAATGQPLCFAGDQVRIHPSWSEQSLSHLPHLPSQACHSLLVYPIADQHKNVIGVIRLENKIERRSDDGFSDADLKLVELLAAQIGAAARKIHLQQIAKSVAGGLTLAELLPQIARSATEVVPADLAVIIPYDDETQQFVVSQAATFPIRENPPLESTPREDGLTQSVARAPKGYVTVPDLSKEPQKQSSFAVAENVRSFIAVSLRAHDRMVGVLYCNFSTSKPLGFSPEEISNALAFGELAAIALFNARLISRLSTTLDQLSRFHELTRTALLKMQLDSVDSVLDVVADTVCSVIGFEFCTISLINRADQTIETRRGKNVPVAWVQDAVHSLHSMDIQADICRTGMTEILTGWDDRFDRTIYDRFDHRNLVRVFAPITGKDGVIGTVEAGFKAPERSISDEDVLALSRYLEQIALLIESAQLVEQERTLGKQLQEVYEVSREMSIAALRGDVGHLLSLAHKATTIVTCEGALIEVRLGSTCWPKSTPKGRNQPVIRETLAWLQQETEYTSIPKIHHAIGPNVPVAAACFSLDAGTNRRGTLCIVYEKSHYFTVQERQKLELCADLITMWLSITQDHQNVRARWEELSREMARVFHSALGQPIANILHSLENLVDGVIDEEQPTPTHIVALEETMSEVAWLDQQVKHLLTLRQVKRGPLALVRQEVNVAQMVRTALDRVRYQARERQIAIEHALHLELETMCLDEAKMVTTLTELLSNAIKYTPSDGKIELDVVRNASELRIRVRDTGCGIDPAYQTRIFDEHEREPNKSTSRRYGVGLGLYLVRHCVETHGGTITVSSFPDEGSTFCIRIPST